MALTATMYRFAVQISDVDRGVYEKLDLRVAQQPSETAEYMVTRVLAYCLEYTEGISLTAGVAAGDGPAGLVRDLTGRITTWIEVGAPDAARIHRAAKLAGRVAVYTHRPIRVVMEQLAGKAIHRADEIPIYTFDPGFIDQVTAMIERRNKLALTITERQIYLDLGGRTLTPGVEKDGGGEEGLGGGGVGGVARAARGSRRGRWGGGGALVVPPAPRGPSTHARDDGGSL